MTVTQRLLGVVRGVLFCRLMSDQELGQWSMTHSLLMMLAPLAVLGLPGSFGKFVEHYSHSGQLYPFLRWSGRICTATTLAMGLGMAILPDFFSRQIFGESGHHLQIYLAAGSLIALTWMNYLTSLVEAMRQIRLATVVRFCSGTSFTLIAVVLLLSPVDASVGALISFGLSCVIGAVPALWFLRRRQSEIRTLDRPLRGGELVRRLAPFAAWWWVSNIVHNSFELVDRYMLVHWSGMQAFEVQAALGQYHSSRVVPLLMVGVAAMLSGLLLPYVSAALAAGDARRARQQLNLTIKFSSLGMLLGNALMLAAAPWMFEWLLQGKYSEGLAILPLTLVYCTWFSVLTVAQDYLWVSEKGKFAVSCMVLGLVSNIVLNAVLIPLWGLWGAVIATAIGNLLGVVTMFVANQLMGCPPDRGCWLALLFPLALLFEPAPAVGISIVVATACLGTRFFFSPSERQMLDRLVRSRFGRIGRQF